MSEEPLKGASPDGNDYEHDYHQGLQLVRRTLKERTPTPPSGLRNPIGPMPEADGPPYDVRDVGGKDFEIGAEFESPYQAIRVNGTGDVGVETATGDYSVIAADGSGTLEEITVQRVVPEDTTVDASDIVLYQ